MKFNEWKTFTIVKLIKMREESQDEKLKEDLNTLLTKLFYAKKRDLTTVFYLMHTIARDDNFSKILELIPSPEELEQLEEKD
ncbi:hypothetical protein [Thermofilum sp.]|uniref:hypothetical protein n=1 Tax=Thermofilum sp. TaxID=1961369 RepID=UPI0031801ED3